MMRLKLIFLLAFLLLALGWQGTRAQNVNHAGLVVRFGDGSVVTACVQFTSESVSGADLLRLSGMNVIVDPGSSFGEAICKISAGPNSDGCDFPLQDCFCQCRGVDCVYWAYYHLKDNAWEYSGQGASNWRVKDGDVEGWAWGPGSAGDSDVEPPIIPFDQICILSTPTPTPTNTPAATDTPTVTPTSPVSTPTPTPTPSPTVTPTPSATPTATLSPTPTASPTLAPGVTPSPTATPRPPITIDFQLAPSTIEPGACAQLQWRITDADTAFLDDGSGESNVPLVSEREVCPMQSTTYTLRAFRPDAQQSATQTLNVMMSAASPTPTATPTPTASPTPAVATATPVPTTPVITPEATAAVGPTPVVATFQPIQRLTPAPEPGSQSGGVLLNLGIFAIVLALIAAAGAWALLRQSR